MIAIRKSVPVAADPRPHLPEQVLKEKPARQGETAGFSGPNKAGMAVQTRDTRIQGSANFTAVWGVNFQKVVSVALPARPQEAKPCVQAAGQEQLSSSASLFPLLPHAALMPITKKHKFII